MKMEENLRMMNEIQTVCWICKTELREEEVCKVTDGQSLHVDVCFDCYGIKSRTGGFVEKAHSPKSGIGYHHKR